MHGSGPRRLGCRPTATFDEKGSTATGHAAASIGNILKTNGSTGRPIRSRLYRVLRNQRLERRASRLSPAQCTSAPSGGKQVGNDSGKAAACWGSAPRSAPPLSARPAIRSSMISLVPKVLGKDRLTRASRSISSAASRKSFASPNRCASPLSSNAAALARNRRTNPVA